MTHQKKELGQRLMLNQDCTTHDKHTVCAVVLAGGAATRMGGVDKGLVAFAQKTLVETVIDAIKPQADKLVISANRNLDRYREMGYEVVTDKIEGYRGPLVGLLSVMKVEKADFYVTAPCDSPYVAHDYVKKLRKAFDDKPDLKCAAAVSHGYKQPVFMMVRKEALSNLEDFLLQGEHKVRAWLDSMHAQWVEFDDLSLFDNFNTQEEMEKSVARRAKSQHLELETSS